MRSDVRRRVTDILLFVAFVTIGSMVFMGCDRGEDGGIYSPTVVAPSGDDNETLILNETARFALLMNVKVNGQLTQQEYRVGASFATGWYVGSYGKKAKGTAYYYQPHVLKLGRIVDNAKWETVTNVAGHEVCHAETGPAHDAIHWNCMARVASPTYPYPGVSGVAPGITCGTTANMTQPELGGY